MQFEVREPVVLKKDNQKIFGVIHRPLNTEFSSGIVMCHGLAGNKIGRFRSNVTAAMELAKRGITVLRFDFRGSGDSEGEPLDQTVTSAISDTLEALNFLKEDPKVDSDRLALFGRSFGGAIAVQAASRFPVKSIGLWAPIFHTKDWEEAIRQNESLQVSKEEMDDFKRVNGQLFGPFFWKELFAMDIAKSLDKIQDIPLMLIHGEKDRDIPVVHAAKYREARNQGKGLTNFVLIKNGDHDFSSTKDLKTAIEETVVWFEKTL